MEGKTSEIQEKYNSPEYIRELISLFRKHECLWKIKSKSYSNRNLKGQAYSELVEFTKTIDENTTIDILKKKIAALRRAFRKELLKVRDSKRTGSGADEIYEPNLWYYYLLLFLSDQEIPRTGLSNVEEDSEVAIELENDDSLDESQSTQSTVNSQSTSVDNLKIIRESKRKRKPDAVLQEAYKILATPIQTPKENDEFEIIGINVATKFRSVAKNRNVTASRSSTEIASLITESLLSIKGITLFNSTKNRFSSILRKFL